MAVYKCTVCETEFNEAKVALAKGSAAVNTAMCSGEGGILPEGIESSYKYIFEYVPNEYSVTEENLKKSDISLIATGGFRISPDFAKALALGATAVAIGITALIAIGCRQYRICNTGKCPMGITTHDPVLRKRLEIDVAAKCLEIFLRVTNEELKDFARLTGNDDVHKLSIHDLCTTNSEISEHTEIEHV
jgi:glutamate synthase domain-containing protein 2